MQDFRIVRREAQLAVCSKDKEYACSMRMDFLEFVIFYQRIFTAGRSGVK